jgi:hypothetical protein
MTCCLKILSMNTCAIVEALNGCCKVHKREYSERQSITTIITDLLLDFGNPTMKSMIMSTHIVAGMGTGCKVPRCFTVSPLCHCQVSHSTTKVHMSLFMPSQQNECLILSYVF